MLSRFTRTLWFALALAGVVIMAGVTLARRTLPQVSGTIRVPGLHSQVTVARDRWGVPHIYAADEHDLFVAQGYVTAQDRLWQMLLRRQAARGRLSDWLGARAAPADDVLSLQDFSAQATASLSSLDTETRAMLEAYTLGVNACLAACPEPLELTLLKLQGKAAQVESWATTDSLAIAVMVQWAQTQQSGVGLREELVSRVGSARASDLWPEGAVLTNPTPSRDLAVIQALRLAGIPFVERDRVASAPGLPAAWYVATLRSERIAIAGGTWPGVPDVMMGAAIGMATYQNTPRCDLVKHLLALPPEGWLKVRVHGMLRQWDCDMPAKTRLGNASAAVYQAWVWHLARDTFQDELGPDLFARYWATGFAPQTLARLAEQPDDAWWDDVTTPQRDAAGKRDDILRRAYAEALDDLGRHYGDLHTIWEWDTLHAGEFRHPLGGALPLSWLLDRTVKLGGDAPFEPAHPDDPVNPYASVLVSPLVIGRHPDEFALAGGQSGNPFSPHYADLLTLWARSELAPLQDAARPQDLKDVEGVLVLVP